ncbi:alpha/beta fold hydrolase [Legionella clemsonensis]|uniref:Pimeloyl-[acyl-carrier protein] methyl ester esterase n=1 Tax=Legionella clemsonensis TaxID=1867846 RepID=A0A222P251_9GAMM|nr:alpha/beta fold hydrolase [Legionella clemsonensis]ASQ45916.1 Pimeloyl-[acyl-carrier protein] methyl ester esterase [Legionella clemsonensis]
MNLNIKIQGEGPSLVFFHGWGFDHTIWCDLATAFEKKYTLYLVDLPGFGLSSLMNWSQFKSELLQHLPEQFALIGWSMGGLYASRLANELSEQVTHLINIASSPRFIKEKNWPGVDENVFNNFFKNLTENPQQTISEFVNLQLKNQTYNYSPQFLPSIESLKAGLTILADWDLRESLFHFKKPTTYLFGRLDAITPSTTMGAMQKLYPLFNYVMFPKAAHMPFLSHQREFINTLETIFK